jgi:hypothetical protein
MRQRCQRPDEEDSITVCHPQIKDLMPVPKNPFEFVDPQGRVPPVLAEKSELGARGSFDL